jgi:hypothetical protein
MHSRMSPSWLNAITSYWSFHVWCFGQTHVYLYVVSMFEWTVYSNFYLFTVAYLGTSPLSSRFDCPTRPTLFSNRGLHEILKWGGDRAHNGGFQRMNPQTYFIAILCWDRAGKTLAIIPAADVTEHTDEWRAIPPHPKSETWTFI